MSRDEVQSVLKSERYYQAFAIPRRFTFIHSIMHVLSLRKSERLGGGYENSAAQSIDVSNAQKMVRTSRGSVQARNLVITTGGYTGGLNRNSTILFADSDLCHGF